MVRSVQQGTRPTSAPRRLTRAENMRRGLRQLFTGTSIVEMNPSPEGPKTPRLELTIQEHSTRIILPHLSRAVTAPAEPGSMAPQDANPPIHTFITARPITPNSLRGIQRTMSLPQLETRGPSHPFIGVDPEQRYLADLAVRGRRRQSKRKRTSRRRRSCVIDFRDKKIRSKFITCCISAIFLLVMLTIFPDLALALSNREESQEFHVLLILVILLTTIFFCHSLISLCIVAIRAPNEEVRPRMSLTGPGGFADPPRPIRVALARDEEAAGIESEATKVPPPAYGLWRESVRVDPNRIFWQRTEVARAHVHYLPRTHTYEPNFESQRPPSYISEDGVAYVIEAAPRSIAPAAEVPLPIYASEHR